MEIKKITCPACGANITFTQGSRTAKCEYCDTPVYAEGDFKESVKEPANEYTYGYTPGRTTGTADASPRPSQSYTYTKTKSSHKTNSDLPWYLRTIWIIVLGIFTEGAYWIIGPIIRVIRKRRR